MKTELPPPVEAKRLATWGTDIPDDLVLDDKLLAEAIKKVNFIILVVFLLVLNTFVIIYFFLIKKKIIYFFLNIKSH
jgi:hypothetical protein